MDASFVFLLTGAGLAGLCCGGLLVWLFMRSRLAGQRGLADERVQLREAQLVDLERRLAAGEEERAGLRRENGALQARVAELAARLEAEQRQLQEKQELLQEARQELANAFKAISADIFQSNSQRFLELAQQTLAKFQERGMADMETRKRSIQELLLPMHESSGRDLFKLLV